MVASPRVIHLAIGLALLAPGSRAGDPPALGGIPFDTDVGPASTVAGDVDGDGDRDLITNHSFFSSRVTLSRARGDGSFDPPILLASFGAVSGFTSPQQLELHDIDADGDLDLLALPMAVLLGDGDGGFGTPLPIPWQAHFDQPLQGPSGDLDGDGQLDLVIFGLDFSASPLLFSPHVFVGQGDGSFTHLPFQPELAGEVVTWSSLFDHEGDGDLDLVGIRQIDGTINVMAGQGDGTLSPPTPVASLPPLSGLPATFTDMDGDGRMDAVIASDASSGPPAQLWVGLGTRQGGYDLQPPVPLPIPADTSPTALVAGDFDGDGHMDVASSTKGVGGVWLHVGDGAGGLALAGEMIPDTWTFGLEVSDMDGDGRDDLLACDNFGDRIHLLYGSPDSFVDIGFGGAALTLSGAGSAAPMAEVVLTLSGGTPGTTAAFLVSLETSPQPYADGLLVPTPGLPPLFAPVEAALIGRWPPGLSAGTQVLVQAAAGGKLSNALAIVAR